MEQNMPRTHQEKKSTNNQSERDRAGWKGSNRFSQKDDDHRSLDDNQNEEADLSPPPETDYNTGHEEDLNNFEQRKNEVGNIKPPTRVPNPTDVNTFGLN